MGRIGHGDGGRTRRSLRAFALVLFSAIGFVFVFPSALLANDIPASTGTDTCTLKAGPTRTVVRVLDGETLLLDDNRELRLIGALAPRSGDANAATDAWPAEIAAQRLLTSLVLGRTVRLAFGGRQLDRYGRYLAHVFLKDAPGPNRDLWVQGEMLSKGAARAYGLPDSFDCAAELAAHERVAREALKGIWTVGVYRPIPALQTRRIMQQRNRYAIVRGAVRNVARTKSAVYFNFGDDWKTDFTARVGKDVLRANPTFDGRLDSFKGQWIEVRGWIERRNGPLIDIADPAQIAPADKTEQPPTPLADGGPHDSTVKPAGIPGALPDESGEEFSVDVPLLEAPPLALPEPEPGKEKRPADPTGKQPSAINL